MDPIQSACGVSVITFITYPQSQKIGMPNNLKVLRGRKPKSLSSMDKFGYTWKKRKLVLIINIFFKKIESLSFFIWSVILQRFDPFKIYIRNYSKEGIDFDNFDWTVSVLIAFVLSWVNRYTCT